MNLSGVGAPWQGVGTGTGSEVGAVADVVAAVAGMLLSAPHPQLAAAGVWWRAGLPTAG